MKIAEIETEDGTVTAYMHGDGVLQVVSRFSGPNGAYVSPADLARFAAQIAKAMPTEFQAALDALNEER